MQGYRAKVTAVSDGTEAPAGWVKVEAVSAGAAFETDWCAFPALSRGDGFGLWLPPLKDERVLVLFADDDELREQPEIVRSSWDEQNKPPSEDLQRCVLKLPNDVPFEIIIGTAKITFEHNKATFDFGGTENPFARADKVAKRLSQLEEAHNNHTHMTTVGILGAYPSLATTTTVVPTTATADVASSNVTVKE